MGHGRLIALAILVVAIWLYYQDGVGYVAADYLLRWIEASYIIVLCGFIMVPGARLEPARPQWPVDFKVPSLRHNTR